MTREITIEETRPTKVLKTTKTDDVFCRSSTISDNLFENHVSQIPDLKANRSTPYPRCLGLYPAGNMQHKYQKEVSLLSFTLDSKSKLIASRHLSEGYELGSISGYAYSFHNGEEDIVELEHNVFVSQIGAAGNLLSHIGYTAISHLANVSLQPNGIVITTKEINENDLFLYLRLPSSLRTNSVQPHTQWLSDIMKDSFHSRQWFRFPHFLTDMDTMTEIILPYNTAAPTTLVPANQALSWQLFLKYENVSTDKVAVIQFADQQIMLPHNESVMIPAYLPSTIDDIEGAVVRRSVVTSLALDSKNKAQVLASVTHNRERHFDISQQTSMSRIHHPAISLQVQEPGLPLPFRLKSQQRRANHPFQLSESNYATECKVEARQSAIPFAGTGLFAKVSILQGESVCSYGGELLHRDEYQQYKDLFPDRCQFCLAIRHDEGSSSSYIIDGNVNFGGSMGRFANEPVYPITANVKLRWVNTTQPGGEVKSGYISFVATRCIEASGEIYFKYGTGYVRVY